MSNINNLIISMRRHAHTDKSGEMEFSQNRLVDDKGIQDLEKLRDKLRSHNIIGGYSSSAIRSQQTLSYLMDGINQKGQVMHCLDEPIIGKEFRELANANASTRDERIGFYLKNSDLYNKTTTPYEAACGAAQFVALMDQRFKGNSGRIEAITNAPKLEAFLHEIDEGSFENQLEGRAFNHLEGIELTKNQGVYVINFRDKKMQVPEYKILELADQYIKSFSGVE